VCYDLSGCQINQMSLQAMACSSVSLLLMLDYASKTVLIKIQHHLETFYFEWWLHWTLVYGMAK
jgi:uncharacterized protein YvpB